MYNQRAQKGFTLIELLVVISIIAVLMSIMVPSLRRAREQAKALMCGTRLKDIGSAINLYAADYNGALPPSYPITEHEQDQANNNSLDFIWIARVAPYYYKTNDFKQGFNMTPYNSVYFRCPTQEYYLKMIKKGKKNSPKTGRELRNLYPAAGTYGINWYTSGLGLLNGDQTYNWRYIGKAKNPSKLPLVSDIAAEPYYGVSGELQNPPVGGDLGGWLMVPTNPHGISHKYGWNGGDNLYGPAALHQGKINYLFTDCHVEKVSNLWPWTDNNDYEGPNDRLEIFHPQGKAGL